MVDDEVPDWVLSGQFKVVEAPEELKRAFVAALDAVEADPVFRAERDERWRILTERIRTNMLDYLFDPRD